MSLVEPAARSKSRAQSNTQAAAQKSGPPSVVLCVLSKQQMTSVIALTLREMESDNTIEIQRTMSFCVRKEGSHRSTVSLNRWRTERKCAGGICVTLDKCSEWYSILLRPDCLTTTTTSSSSLLWAVPILLTSLGFNRAVWSCYSGRTPSCLIRGMFP